MECPRCSKNWKYVGFERNAKGLFFYWKCEFCGNFQKTKKSKGNGFRTNNLIKEEKTSQREKQSELTSF